MRKKTIRKMYPLARKQAHLCNELKSVHTRLSNLIDKINSLEFYSKAKENEIAYTKHQ